MNRKLRMLVVDDSEWMIKQITEMATRLDFEVIGSAKDGIEALRKYEIFHPDIVTMDITMPKLDGLTTIEHIMMKHPKANIVVISAMTQKKLALKALQLGAKHFIIKPFDMEKFETIIMKVTSSVVE